MPDEADLLSDIHGELTKELLKRIKEGTATAADLSVARQFLKDNRVEAGNIRSRKNKPLRDLADIVPFNDEATGT